VLQERQYALVAERVISISDVATVEEFYSLLFASTNGVVLDHGSHNLDALLDDLADIEEPLTLVLEVSDQQPALPGDWRDALLWTLIRAARRSDSQFTLVVRGAERH
jgi:hypothetical protein